MEIQSDRVSALFKHIKNDQNRKATFRCELCGKVYMHERSLKQHTRTHQPDHVQAIFKCNQPGCDKTFNTRENVNHHFDVVHLNKYLSCDLCSATFKENRWLVRHKLRIHEKIEPHFCETCHKGFISNHILKIHLQTHIPGYKRPMYKCDICFKEYAKMDTLKNHKINVHQEIKERIQCPSCPVTCRTVIALDRHKKQKHPLHDTPRFTCGMCHAEYVSKSELDRHISYRHTKEKPYKCEVPKCLKSFVTRFQLKLHEKAKHSLPENIIRYPCPHLNCGASYKCKNMLTQHVKDVHVDKATICRICGKTLYSKSSLKRHVNVVHNKERKFTCNFCYRKFSSLRGFEMHIAVVHLKEKLFKCYFCRREFSTMDNLGRHMTTHLRLKPIMCEACGKRFYSHSLRRTHYRRRGLICNSQNF